MNKTVNVVRVDKGLDLPSYATPLSAGMDLYARVDEPVTVPANGGRILIPTGIKIALPTLGDGFLLEAQVRPRSGLALKKGITVTNSPGTIDADYRGEIGVILQNESNEDFVVNKGDRIAQLVYGITVQLKWNEVEDLDVTERNDGGFGHTGV